MGVEKSHHPPKPVLRYSEEPALAAAQSRSPQRTSRHGTTLIEVLAGLVILGTLLASVAIARGRFVRIWSDADQRLLAADEIDRLMHGWLAGPPKSVPTSSQGFFDDRNHHIWKTRIIPDPAAASVGAAVVRVQIFRSPPDTAPLGQVDFLLHKDAR